MTFKVGSISLNKRLYGFVGVISLLALAAVGVGAFYYSNIVHAIHVKEDVSRVVEKLLNTRVTEKTYLLFYTAELKKQFDDMSRGVGEQVRNLDQAAVNAIWKKHIGSVGHDFERYRGLFDELAQIHAQQSGLREEMVKPLRISEELLRGVGEDLEKTQAQRQMEGETLSAQEFGMLNVVTDCRAAFLQLQNLQLQYLLRGDAKLIDEYKKLASGGIQSSLIALEQFASALKNNTWVKHAATVMDSLNKFLEFIEQSQKLYEKENERSRLLNDTGKQIVEAANTLSIQVEQSIADQQKSALRILAVMFSAALLFFWILSFVLVRSISKPIHHVIQGLSEAAEEVTHASRQVCTAGQELADGASQQAAAIEETSSSLEEMSSMTKWNAENANHANHLMKEAKQTMVEANGSMERLTASMGEISGASEKTQKIIKTIDEIAFQTNLLALNAAVEAARAGEAGAGFAVVADEVRNLAKRAAEAAQNTATLIEATVLTVKEGAELVGKTNGEFRRLSDSASKVGELVGEIALASQEQSQGIDQINRAVVEVDKVVQRNAANAEESASASAEMTARAGQMKEFVQDLTALVNGNRNTTRTMVEAAEHPEAGRRAMKAFPTHFPKTLPQARKGNGRADQKEAKRNKEMPKEFDPKKVIPLDEHDFDEF
jgi:methyl-accepting chemotaxis protein